jgi:hypothetical protein
MTPRDLNALLPRWEIPYASQAFGAYLHKRRSEIRARYRPAPTPAMTRFLHALAAIGPEAERLMRWDWPAWIPSRPFDFERDA